MDEALALINTICALTSAALMIAGRRAMRRQRDRRRHAALMIGAVVASAAFLVGFVLRYVLYGPTPMRAGGALKVIYYAFLFAHEPLAIVNIPLVLAAMGIALAGNFRAHREMAEIAWPIWLWSCASGAIVYVLLHVLPRF